LTKMPSDLKDVFDLAGDEALKRQMLSPGGLAVITAGFPIFGTPTNLVYIHKPGREGQRAPP